jgi:hypothetical protein
MKKLLTIALTLALILGLTACGCAANKPAANPGTNPSGNSQTDPNTDPGGSDAVLDGSLCFIDRDDRDSSVLRGVRFSGNRSGSDEFNSKPPATSGIRCIFELNEWVAAMPDTDVTSGILVYVLPHREDQKYYETAQFSGDMPDLAAVYNMEHIDGEGWGAFYLNPEEAEAGYYDFVFVYEGKAIATLLTRFYDEGQLENLTDKELYECMNSWETAVFTG